MTLLDELKQAWMRFHEEHPGVPLREAARELEVSEAELLSTFFDDGATRLIPDWPKLIAFIPQIGKALYECRTENAIMEASGSLDFKYHAWRYLFAVEEETHEQSLQSLQIYGASGQALLKIYLSQECEPLFKKITASLQDAAQNLIQGLHPFTWTEKPDGKIDRQELTNQVALAHTLVDFDSIMEQCGVSRTQAYRLLGKTRAVSVNPRSVKSILEKTAAEKLPLTIFLTNPGVIQRCQGSLDKVFLRGPWLVACGDDFNVQLRYPRLGSAWIVQKKIAGMECSTLEYFDKTGEEMLGFTLTLDDHESQRKWLGILAEISRLD